jgi:integrase
VKLSTDESKGRRTWTKAPLTLTTLEAAANRVRDMLKDRADLIAELEHTGRERALIYKVLVLSGLRKGELASLTVGQVELEIGAGGTAYATLHAADEKAGGGRRAAEA